ncbi:cytoplasmic tRNA 2-thiolation protein 1 [Acaromyces ingoldii]|uniref:Cytoplasmic tRNA 2-thiolation protein 1 n=1 Tax=Acaromyces ingoldii TaxID=215250 RepID=A0A316YZ34_9BASI|nr:cytoplasmic tRNA 2-thiolation protein 1 [Acaromyces ingoldii]PWN94014.1 cytoplasmic tRNA 2-thiolation protein 1 [Acaromyces ingoldii]
MAPRSCSTCQTARAVLRRPKTGALVCRECFYYIFEQEVHQTIVSASLFQRGDRVAIGASGGKDSTVLAHVLKTLNDRHDYGLELFLLSIDEGITGYRDDSLETVKRNKVQYGLPLKVLGYDELYGWTMDEIVRQVGMKNNCTFCGVFRRQALDRGAAAMQVDHIVTGHNADDMAETILMNVLRGDIARLERCTEICTKGPDPQSSVGQDAEGGGCGNHNGNEFGGTGIKRSKPFKYAYEKEIVMYAYFKKLDYFSTECIYYPNAYRGYAREYLRELEQIRPSAVIDIIHSGEALRVGGEVKRMPQRNCQRCGYISSNDLCKACLLLEGLNRGAPSLGIHSSKSRYVKEARKGDDEGEASLKIGRKIPMFQRIDSSSSTPVESTS